MSDCPSRAAAGLVTSSDWPSDTSCSTSRQSLARSGLPHIKLARNVVVLVITFHSQYVTIPFPKIQRQNQRTHLLAHSVLVLRPLTNSITRMLRHIASQCFLTHSVRLRTYRRISVVSETLPPNPRILCRGMARNPIRAACARPRANPKLWVSDPRNGIAFPRLRLAK